MAEMTALPSREGIRGRVRGMSGRVMISVGGAVMVGGVVDGDWARRGWFGEMRATRAVARITHTVLDLRCMGTSWRFMVQVTSPLTM